MALYRCPQCHANDNLWESVMVSGWRSVDQHGRPNGQKEADWEWVERDGDVGCGECDWRGSSFERLGIDGNPLPDVHPRQQQIAAA